MEQRPFLLPFSEHGRKGENMARYFMSGTKYEDFERMMMSPDRKCSDDREQDGVPSAQSEAQKGVTK